MKIIIYLIGLSFFLISCNNEYSAEVEEALRLAGENRNELEEVLSYCKKRDKIAYKSACFLIENMKYHESETNNPSDSSYIHFFSLTDSIFNAIFGKLSLREIKFHKGKEYDSLRISLAAIFNKVYPVKKCPLEYLKDLQTIRADFLIDNIESALHIMLPSNF